MSEAFLITEDHLSVRLVDVLAAHFGMSKSAVRRDIDHGGLRILGLGHGEGGEKYTHYVADYGYIKHDVLRLGKKKFVRITLDTTDSGE
jgi:tyrosyl-tRNA synthetase